MDGHSFQYDQCLSVNFGYNDDQFSVPQVSMTPESNTKLNFDSPTSCIFVIIGGKYLRMIRKVMEKVNSVTNDVGRSRPLAVFLINDKKYKESIDIDVDYGLDRYKSTPVMVKLNNTFICLQ